MTQPVNYFITVPPDHIDELAAFMAERNIPFDPNRNVIAVNEAFMDQSMALGHHVPQLLSAVNRRLRENGLQPTIPENHGEWNPETTREFLELAVTEFAWSDDRITHALWEEDGRTWREVTEDRPLLFPGEAAR